MMDRAAYDKAEAEKKVDAEPEEEAEGEANKAEVAEPEAEEAGQPNPDSEPIAEELITPGGAFNTAS